ncbi:MAG: 50S ribosomal protein L17 [Candidatus Competibacteraceae bacterium]|nr:50S ribosomal protein L17 [Candidatus Competibacteraceae bacterium]
MRHGKKDNHLGRKTAHRHALLANLASSLIMHKRINTTLAKAKELRKYLEPIITKSKSDSTHSRRVVFSELNNKEAVAELFRDVAAKVSDRPGGYLRIIKLGNRQGDNAEMAMIELVDYNPNMLKDKSAKAPAKKRTRRAGSAAPKAKAESAAETSTEITEENAPEA